MLQIQNTVIIFTIWILQINRSIDTSIQHIDFSTEVPIGHVVEKIIYKMFNFSK